MIEPDTALIRLSGDGATMRLGPFVFTPAGLHVDGEPTHEEWKKAGRVIGVLASLRHLRIRRRRQPTPLQQLLAKVPAGPGVYFIERHDGLIKIGMATHLVNRVEEVLTEHRPAKVLFTISTASRFEARRLEYRLHWQFAPDNVIGEWFRPAPTLTTFLHEQWQTNS